MLTVTIIESILNKLLQRFLSFNIKDKTVKRGKLVLFVIKDYHITFFVKVNGMQKKYEIPYPFDIKINKTPNGAESVVFDYTNDTLAYTNNNLLFKLNNIKTKPSKLFNTQLTIVEEN